MEVLLILVEAGNTPPVSPSQGNNGGIGLDSEVIISLLVVAVVPVVLVVMDLVKTLVVLVVLDHQLRSRLQLLNFMLVVEVGMVKAVVVLVVLVGGAGRTEMVKRDIGPHIYWWWRRRWRSRSPRRNRWKWCFWHRCSSI